MLLTECHEVVVIVRIPIRTAKCSRTCYSINVVGNLKLRGAIPVYFVCYRVVGYLYPILSADCAANISYRIGLAPICALVYLEHEALGVGLRGFSVTY